MPPTVLITGCSSGFGATTARLFAARGWNVAATMRRPERGAALATLDNVLVTRLDVQDRAGIEAAVKLVEPGGVVSTGFGRRSGLEADAVADAPDYGPFVEATRRVFADLRASRAGATGEQVAEVIFSAATDGTDRLRYVATADIEPLVALRRETSEAEYIAFMRERFAP